MNYNNLKKNNLFFIAEAGSNFNQDSDTGKKLILAAKSAGAHAIKFQLFKAKSLYPKNKKMYKIFKKIELDYTMFKIFKKFADKNKILISASAFDLNSAKFLEKCNVKFHKVASSELTNFELLNYLSKTKKPIILSTGMSDLNDVNNAIKICEKNNNFNISIMQCGSLYPLKYKDNNLNVLESYKNNFNYQVGLSDHTLDDLAAITSIGLGARIFEKHFTLSKNMNGPDHFYAMEPSELKKYFSNLTNSMKCLGSFTKKLLPGEKLLSRRKGIYFKKSLKKGEILKKQDILLKSPPLGLLSTYSDKIVSKKLCHNVKKNDPVFLRNFKI